MRGAPAVSPVPTRTVLRWPLEDGFARALPELCVPWRGAAAPAPRRVVFNHALARELGLPEGLDSPAGAALLCGAASPADARPVAMAYAGHQFGQFVPRLGDGRALLLGEFTAVDGTRRDLHLKGSGPTPFARGGDGKAALGPMLREYLVSEALHALGIPTTRSLAVVATGETIHRDTPQPGAVLARVAASHLRVGTFEYLAARGDVAGLRRLADYAIERHDPDLAGREDRVLRLLERVIERQAALVARWMAVGFVHGVMNTDNMTLSGETIDYGPCAFMDAYDPATVFSSIDRHGRYAYGNQPRILQWNLARLAETLIPLLDSDTERALRLATERIEAVPERYRRHWLAQMRDKLGLSGEAPEDAALIEDWLDLLHRHQVDFTLAFRALTEAAGGDEIRLRRLFTRATEALDAWLARWRRRAGTDPRAAAARMARANPVYIPRNHRVEEALQAAATEGDLRPFERLLDALRTPHAPRPGLERYETPAPPELGPYVTFCGT